MQRLIESMLQCAQAGQGEIVERPYRLNAVIEAALLSPASSIAPSKPTSSVLIASADRRLQSDPVIPRDHAGDGPSPGTSSGASRGCRSLMQLLFSVMPISLGRTVGTAPLLPQLVCESGDGGVAYGFGSFVFIRFWCFGVAVYS